VPIRVAINGFGRIGRQILQAGYKNKNIQWVAINDVTDTQTLAHLLKYDSTFGMFPDSIKSGKDWLEIDKKKIKVLNILDPGKLPWKKLNIDIVAECTGKFTDREGAQLHLKAGAKRVLVSAPCKGPDFTIVLGANHQKLKPSHRIVSNGSCTTNAVVHLAKTLHEAFTIERAYMNTVHAYTADQRLVDSPHKDLRRARAAAANIIPTTTGAAKTVGEICPELRGKVDGVSIRVPVQDGSIAILTAQVKKKATKEQVNKIFRSAAARLKGIVEYSQAPLVSRDILHNPNSCIFDSLSTAVTDNSLVTVAGWYDNEWGFSCRMVEVLELMGKQLKR
jgi:glyceraldehyde 3-phosphate dehydrogenase